MRSRKLDYLLTLGLASILGTGLSAQAAAPDKAGPVFRDFYDSQLLHVGFRPWDGVTLSYQGQTSGTAFGVDPRFADLLEKYPESRLRLQNYRSLNLAGDICLWGGVGVTIVGFFLPSWTNNSSSATLGTSLGMVLTGLTSSLVGIALLPAGQSQIARSAEAYNRSRIDEMR